MSHRPWSATSTMCLLGVCAAALGIAVCIYYASETPHGTTSDADMRLRTIASSERVRTSGAVISPATPQSAGHAAPASPPMSGAGDTIDSDGGLAPGGVIPKVIFGRLTSVSKNSITIEGMGGDAQTLVLTPGTQFKFPYSKETSAKKGDYVIATAVSRGSGRAAQTVIVGDMSSVPTSG